MTQFVAVRFGDALGAVLIPINSHDDVKQLIASAKARYPSFPTRPVTVSLMTDDNQEIL